MDTTKQNILMCEKAEEIQKIYLDFSYPDNWLVEDIIVVCKEHQKRLRFCNIVKDPCEGTIGNLCVRKSNQIWIPSQNQLQEMVKGKFIDYVRDTKFDSTILMCSAFWRFVNDRDEDCFSMEQLWLAFVMKELYNKIWNGKDWIKE